MTDYYKSSAEETLKELQTSQTGLTSQQAQARQEKYGINKLKEAEKPGFLKRFFLQLKDPMLLILLAAALRLRRYLTRKSRPHTRGHKNFPGNY